MSTYRELIYMCLDEIKVISDDSYFEEEHVSFLLDKFRPFLLKQRYGDVRKEVPQSNYQEICLDLKEVQLPQGSICGKGTFLTSVEKIPNTIAIGTQHIYPGNVFDTQISYISKDRIKYVGTNRYLQNIIYVALMPDQHLYFKSANPQFLHLEKVKMSAVFSDGKEAFDHQCPDEDGNVICEPLDMRFPIEDALIPPLIQLVVKELLGPSYRPQDSVNNATDDLSEIASFIRNNMRSNFQKDVMQ